MAKTILTPGKDWGTINISSFDTDGGDYGVLKEAAEAVTDVKGMTCEIGVRAGGSSKVIIDGIMTSNPKGIRTHVAIDPYGALDYDASDEVIITGAYSSSIRDIAVPALFRYCVGSKVNFVFFQMTDDQFMKRFKDGVPVYVANKEYVLNNYALVYFDGIHTTEAVMAETKFFGPKALPGAVYVYDDYKGAYDHDKVHEWLLKHDWTVKTASRQKISYVKG